MDVFEVDEVPAAIAQHNLVPDHYLVHPLAARRAEGVGGRSATSGERWAKGIYVCLGLVLGCDVEEELLGVPVEQRGEVWAARFARFARAV
jgi:hypothetical protein